MNRLSAPRIGQKIADVSSEGGGLVAKMSLWLQQQLKLLGRNPDTTTTTLIYSASPVFFENTSDFDQDFVVMGGTVSSVGFTRDGGMTYFEMPVASTVRLNPGDAARVVYSVPPSITVIPR